MDNNMAIYRNNSCIFDLELSKNNLVKYLQIGNTVIRHTFDIDYNYEHKDLKSWEVHGKMVKKDMEYVLNNINSAYCFYYSDTVSGIFVHDSKGIFKVTIMSKDFDEYEYDECIFTDEEFIILKHSLIKLFYN